jgi:hypothetical protein
VLLQVISMGVSDGFSRTMRDYECLERIDEMALPILATDDEFVDPIGRGRLAAPQNLQRLLWRPRLGASAISLSASSLVVIKTAQYFCARRHD